MSFISILFLFFLQINIFFSEKMRNCKYLMLMLFSFITEVFCFLDLTNITSTIEKYVLTYGFKLCDSSISSYQKHTKFELNGTVCSDCFCDIQCLRRRDCCPDLNFNGPSISCMSEDILLGASDKTYLTISCPRNANDNCAQYPTKRQQAY